MKVQIDTIQCRRLYERLRSGRAQLEQAQRDVQHARMHLRAQTCPAQKQALRQAEQAIAALEEELERAAFSLFQIAGTYEMYEQSVQSQLRQLPGRIRVPFARYAGRSGCRRAALCAAYMDLSRTGAGSLSARMGYDSGATHPDGSDSPAVSSAEVPARIRDILDARVAEPRREWIERLPVPAAAAAASGASRRRRTAVMADRRSPAPLADTERIFPDGG